MSVFVLFLYTLLLHILSSAAGNRNVPFIGFTMKSSAKLYSQNNMLQKRDALICLNDYTPRMKWKDFDKIIDVGCGDGNVTSSIKNYMPNNFKELVGCDINEKMVEFANEQYADHRTRFIVIDIVSNLPQELKGEFNHVFSFYTMHWPKQQRKAFTNIYELLSKGGDCLISLLAYAQVYSSVLAVGVKEKWKALLPTAEGFVSPYHDMLEPEKYIKNMLKEIGFIDIEVTCKQMFFVYQNENSFKKMIESLSLLNISADDTNDFIKDCVTVLRDMRVMNNPKDGPSNSTEVKMYYNMIVIYARK